MTDSAENNIVIALITEIRTKLEEGRRARAVVARASFAIAVSIAKAAESCAINGSVNHAVPILMEFEGFAHEAQDLLRANAHDQAQPAL